MKEIYPKQLSPVELVKSVVGEGEVKVRIYMEGSERTEGERLYDSFVIDEDSLLEHIVQTGTGGLHYICSQEGTQVERWEDSVSWKD